MELGGIGGVISPPRRRAGAGAGATGRGLAGMIAAESCSYCWYSSPERLGPGGGRHGHHHCDHKLVLVVEFGKSIYFKIIAVIL